jgi:copper(I)-binding protein
MLFYSLTLYGDNNSNHPITTIHQHDSIVENAFIRTTAPGTTTTAAYFTFNNHSNQKMHLISANSVSVERVEIHEHAMKGGLMKMQKIDSLAIDPESSITFKPGGYHLMLIGIKPPIKTNDNVVITLNFANGHSKTFTASAADHI